LVRTAELFLAAFDKALRHHRLSRAGREALAILEGAGQPLSPTVIAERLIVTTASVTSVLDTLERRGLVERRPHPSDRRRVLVAITDDGIALVNLFLPEMIAAQTAMFAGLSEAQRTQLIELLARATAGLADVDIREVLRTSAPRVVPRRD
jgi:DNA-binding MarR family transcriptional regulator